MVNSVASTKNGGLGAVCDRQDIELTVCSVDTWHDKSAGYDEQYTVKTD